MSFVVDAMLYKIIINPSLKAGVIVIIFMIAQQKVLSFENLLFQPLTANVFEPRIGSMYQFSDEKLRLDIGASVDLYEFKLINPLSALNEKEISEDGKMSLGADFFTYTRLRSEGKFKFPVETSDYFFGINSSFFLYIFNKEVFSRLRVAHISSHLVDGYSKDGVFGKMPFIYSREFIDIVFAVNLAAYRLYAGFNYAFSSQPKNIKIFTPQIGVDFNSYLNNFIKLVGGFDFKYTKPANRYETAIAYQFGLLFESSKNTGILFSYYSYEGSSIHGMFYNQNDNYNAIGFQIYFY